jgi:hypothetical protein
VNTLRAYPKISASLLKAREFDWARNQFSDEHEVNNRISYYSQSTVLTGYRVPR